MAEHTDRRGARAAQGLAVLLGVVYLVLGLAGFFAEDRIWVFSTGPLLSIVHTAIGVLALLAARRGRGAQVWGFVIFAGLVGLTVFGVLSTATGQPADVRQLFDVDWADNWLHGVTAVLGLFIGLVPDVSRRV